MAGISMATEAQDLFASNFLRLNVDNVDRVATREVEQTRQNFAEVSKGLLPDTRILMNAAAVVASLGETKNAAGDTALKNFTDDAGSMGGTFTGTRRPNRFVGRNEAVV